LKEKLQTENASRLEIGDVVAEGTSWRYLAMLAWEHLFGSGSHQH
jgi:hypothetical protein